MVERERGGWARKDGDREDGQGKKGKDRKGKVGWEGRGERMEAPKLRRKVRWRRECWREGSCDNLRSSHRLVTPGSF